MNRLIVILLILSFSEIVYSQDIYRKRKGSKYIYVDQNGRQSFKQKFKDANPFYEGLAGVEIDGKWGYINETGALVIANKYEAVSDFKHEIAYVKEDNAYYFIDSEANLLSEKYDSISPMRAYYILKEKDTYGIADSVGNVLAEPQFSQIGGYYQGQFTVKFQEQWGSWKNGKLDLDNEDLYFVKPEKVPVFSSACRYETDEGRLKMCSDRRLLETVYRKIKYPREARMQGVQGTIVIEFVIDKEGQVLNPKILRGIGAGCDEEGLKLVRGFDKWYKPGEQDGKPVNTVYILPLKFRLE